MLNVVTILSIDSVCGLPNTEIEKISGSDTTVDITKTLTFTGFTLKAYHWLAISFTRITYCSTTENMHVIVTFATLMRTPYITNIADITRLN